jgi:hypothetical protein
VHGDATAATFDEAHDVELLVARRHAVDDRDNTVVGGELGLEYEGVISVPTAHGARFALRSEQPAPVVRRAEEGGEAGAGVEAREGQPVDGSVSADERAGLLVGQERLVLEGLGLSTQSDTGAWRTVVA